MKLIDELKKQAKDIVGENDLNETEDNALAVLLQSEIDGKLHEIHAYLSDLIEQLRIIKPEIRTHRKLEKYGTINDLVQCEHRVFSESTFYQITVGITFIQQCQQRCKISDVTEENMNPLINKLQHLGLDIVLQSKGKLEVEGKFPASLIFSTNIHQRFIKFSVNNIESTDSLFFELKPEKINDDFINELGKMLLQKENSLLEKAAEICQEEQPRTVSNNGAEDTEPTLTELMDFPLVHGLFKDRHQMYLTYRENIQEITSRNDGVVLGRSSKCDMVIPSDFASRQHARIVYRKGKFVVSDHSTNGTFIKPQGTREIYIHGEDYPLSGSGFISLGESTAVDNEHLIYFSCH